MRILKNNDKAPDKKNFNNPNEINTAEDIAIPMYAPNMGLIPKEYYISTQLDNLETNFENICQEFIEKAKPDQFNSTFLDPLIDKIEKDAGRLIEVQRADHVRLIERAINAMHKGDLTIARNKLTSFQEEKAEAQEELERWRKISFKGTIFEEV